MSHLKLVPPTPDFTLAACREPGVNFDWFFPSGRRTPTSVDMSYRKARAVCVGCPVCVTCLEWELQYEGRTGRGVPGMFGGKTPRERLEIVKQRREQQ